MKLLFPIFIGLLVSSCAHTARTTSPAPTSQVGERVYIRTSKGDKEVLICSPKLADDEAGIVVRLKCKGEEVLALQSYQTPYLDLTSANESVRINWREDGNAVVVNLCINGGTQETRPYFIMWDGCAARDVTYDPIWPANHIGDETIYFAGWDNSGKPILKAQ